MMTYVYLALFAVSIAVELSDKVSTENILKKIAIGFIAVGALVEYSGVDSHFIEVGVLTLLAATLLTAYVCKPKRRNDDK